MNKTRSRHRATIESPNNIQNLYRDIQHIFKTQIPGLEDDSLRDFERNSLIDRHASILNTTVQQICQNAGMSDSDISRYVEPAFTEGSDSVTIEFNFAKFGRVGIEVYDGSTDTFSSTNEVYRFSLPTRDGIDSEWDEFENEYSTKSFSDDGVAVALNICRRSASIRMESYIFDRTNEVLTQPVRRSRLQKLVGADKPELRVR